MSESNSFFFEINVLNQERLYALYIFIQLNLIGLKGIPQYLFSLLERDLYPTYISVNQVSSVNRGCIFCTECCTVISLFTKKNVLLC